MALGHHGLLAPLDLSFIEDGAHIALGLVALWAGFLRRSRTAVLATLTLIGVVSLLVAALPATSFVEVAIDVGLLAGAWGAVHTGLHLVAGVVTLCGNACALIDPRHHVSQCRTA